MAEIKLYVVTTNISHEYERDCLKNLKIELCKKFEGLTVIKGCEGLWLDEKDEIVTDSTDIWQIATHNVDIKYLWNLSEKLRKICKQTTQLFTVDGLPFFVYGGI